MDSYREKARDPHCDWLLCEPEDKRAPNGPMNLALAWERLGLLGELSVFSPNLPFGPPVVDGEVARDGRRTARRG